MTKTRSKTPVTDAVNGAFEQNGTWRGTKLYRATADIPSIKAREGDFVLDVGSGSLCVFHDARANALTPEDGFKLIPLKEGES